MSIDRMIDEAKREDVRATGESAAAHLHDLETELTAAKRTVISLLVAVVVAAGIIAMLFAALEREQIRHHVAPAFSITPWDACPNACAREHDLHVAIEDVMSSEIVKCALAGYLK